MAGLPDETGEADFAGCADLPKNQLRARDSLFPLRAIDVCGNVYLVNIDTGPVVGNDLPVIQEEDAERK